MPTKMPRWLWPRHWGKKEVLTCWIFDDFWEVFVKNKTFIRIFVSKSWKLAGVTMVWGRIVLVWPNLHPFVGSDHRNRKRSTQGDCRGPWVPKPLTDVTPHFPSYLCVCWERHESRNYTYQLKCSLKFAATESQCFEIPRLSKEAPEESTRHSRELGFIF